MLAGIEVANYSTARILKISLGAVLLVIIVYALLFGSRTYFLVQVLQEAKKNPFSRMTPKPLSLETDAGESGARLTYLGYSFQTPWPEMDSKVMNSSDSAVQIFFGPDRVIALYIPAKQPPFPSYAFTKAILETTPEQIHIFMPRERDANAGFLLRVKEIEARWGQTGIFTFETPFIRGFQYGDPTKHAYPISVKAFDSADQEIDLWFGTRKGSSAVLTQAEINRVLRTLRRASESSSSKGSAAEPVR
jgi:hypothetical protein